MTAVLVTRPSGAGDQLVSVLQARGYRVAAVPTVLTQPIPVEWPDLTKYDWVVVTSAAAVALLPDVVRGPRWAAVGKSTAQALHVRGIEADFVPEEVNGAAVAAALPDPGGRRVLFVRASMASPDLPHGLRARGALVDEVVAYETVEGPASSSRPLREALSQPDVVAVLFASGSAVRGFIQLGGGTNLPAITIGPRTSAVARGAGFTVIAEAAGQNVHELAAAVGRAIPIEVKRDA